jgi:hypothetical protein
MEVPILQIIFFLKKNFEARIPNPFSAKKRVSALCNTMNRL